MEEHDCIYCIVDNLPVCKCSTLTETINSLSIDGQIPTISELNQQIEDDVEFDVSCDYEVQPTNTITCIELLKWNSILYGKTEKLTVCYHDVQNKKEKTTDEFPINASPRLFYITSDSKRDRAYYSGNIVIKTKDDNDSVRHYEGRFQQLEFNNKIEEKSTKTTVTSLLSNTETTSKTEQSREENIKVKIKTTLKIKFKEITKHTPTLVKIEHGEQHYCFKLFSARSGHELIIGDEPDNKELAMNITTGYDGTDFSEIINPHKNKNFISPSALELTFDVNTKLISINKRQDQKTLHELSIENINGGETFSVPSSYLFTEKCNAFHLNINANVSFSGKFNNSSLLLNRVLPVNNLSTDTSTILAYKSIKVTDPLINTKLEELGGLLWINESFEHDKLGVTFIHNKDGFSIKDNAETIHLDSPTNHLKIGPYGLLEKNTRRS